MGNAIVDAKKNGKTGKTGFARLHDVYYTALHRFMQ